MGGWGGGEKKTKIVLEGCHMHYTTVYTVTTHRTPPSRQASSRPRAGEFITTTCPFLGDTGLCGASERTNMEQQDSASGTRVLVTPARPAGQS